MMVSPRNESTWQKTVTVFADISVQIIIRMGDSESPLSCEIWVDNDAEDTSVILDDTDDLDAPADADINAVLKKAVARIEHELDNIKCIVFAGFLWAQS